MPVRVQATPKLFRTLADKIEAGELEVTDYTDETISPRLHLVSFFMHVTDKFEHNGKRVGEGGENEAG